MVRNQIIRNLLMAMKISTGLDWLDVKVPYPEKLIDTWLKNQT